MPRITKTKEERRGEIIETAKELFYQKGFNNVAVEDIIKKINVAKGTFYYYFKSKDAVLEAIVENTLEDLIKTGEKVANNKNLSAIKKFELLLSRKAPSNRKASKVTKELHQKQNRKLHEKINVQIVLKFAPILEKIIKQGNREKVFKAKYPLETIQFLLAGTQFLFDKDLFSWNRQEWKKRRKAMQRIVEKSLGAKKNSLNFIK